MPRSSGASASAVFGRSFLATGADDPAIMAKIEKNVPMDRLGTLDEFAQLAVQKCP